MSKNKTLPTPSLIREAFPQFDEERFPDSKIDFRLGLADVLLSENKHGNMFVYLVQLFVAHYLTLDLKDQLESMAGGSGGSSNGIVASKSIHDVSVGYDASMSMNSDAGFWNLTRYGQEFWQYWIMFGFGGRQL